VVVAIALDPATLGLIPAAEFEMFRAAVRAWLATSPPPDPPLAAAADVLATVHTEHQVQYVVLDATDAHAALGARAVLDLWQAIRLRSL
jgi:hypothetical protein